MKITLTEKPNIKEASYCHVGIHCWFLHGGRLCQKVPPMKDQACGGTYNAIRLDVEQGDPDVSAFAWFDGRDQVIPLCKVDLSFAVER